MTLVLDPQSQKPHYYVKVSLSTQIKLKDPGSAWDVDHNCGNFENKCASGAGLSAHRCFKYRI